MQFRFLNWVFLLNNIKFISWSLYHLNACLFHVLWHNPRHFGSFLCHQGNAFPIFGVYKVFRFTGKRSSSSILLSVHNRASVCAHGDQRLTVVGHFELPFNPGKFFDSSNQGLLILGCFNWLHNFKQVFLSLKKGFDDIGRLSSINHLCWISQNKILHHQMSHLLNFQLKVCIKLNNHKINRNITKSDQLNTLIYKGQLKTFPVAAFRSQ